MTVRCGHPRLLKPADDSRMRVSEPAVHAHTGFRRQNYPFGDKLGVDLSIAAIVAFGMRIFNNLGAIRRHYL